MPPFYQQSFLEVALEVVDKTVVEVVEVVDKTVVEVVEVVEVEYLLAYTEVVESFVVDPSEVEH